MTDIRQRLVDALHGIIDEYQCGNITVTEGAAALSSWPGIAIVELPEGANNLELTQFWAVGCGDGDIDGEVTYAHLDSARDALDEALESGYPDAYLATFWATGFLTVDNTEKS